MNHIAFHARDLDDIESRKKRWLDHGHDVVEIDHGFCVSIYTLDPSRILVEFCTDTAPYTAADRAHALAAHHRRRPELEPPPSPQFHIAESDALERRAPPTRQPDRRAAAEGRRRSQRRA